MTTGERIKFFRQKRGMTQKQVAELCGMADSAIRKYESGKIIPKSGTIKKIATALNCPFYLIDDTFAENKEISDKIVELAVAGYTERQIIKALGLDSKEIIAQAFTQEQSEGTGLSLHISLALEKLNLDGLKKAQERVEELTEIPRYCIQDTPQSTGKDITLPPDAVEEPPEEE